MKAWYYFERPTHLAFHDLTTTIAAPKNIRSLLGLGLKFCPIPKFTHKNQSANLARFRRDLTIKIKFTAATPDDDFNPRMYHSSGWTPPPWSIPQEIHQRMDNFSTEIQSIFRKRRGRSNLLPHQRHALQELRKQNKLVIAQCDKNLGPAIVEYETYVQKALHDHLLDQTIYKPLTPGSAANFAFNLKLKLQQWIEQNKHTFSKIERRFLRYHAKNNKNPFPVFYMTMKVHKTPWSTRPIVSCSGSLLHPLGIWIDSKLQKVARLQQSFISSSADLKSQLLQLNLPPNAILFTADAVSMYTNIRTPEALNEIGTYLRTYQDSFRDVPVNPLMSALRLIMFNNVFKFGDTFWHQQTGTAMGTPPAPPYATIFFAIHENRWIFNKFPSLLFYRRFIDDVIGIWLPHDDPEQDAAEWTRFGTALNSYHGMQWEISQRAATVNYMDLTITLQHGHIHTSLHEKALNLYLYIPPHSAHPPGVLTGIVLGSLHRFHTLCSDSNDIKILYQKLYDRLIRRGYRPETLLPLFHRGQQAVLRRLNTPTPDTTDDLERERKAILLPNRVFYHLQFHPGNPPSSDIQHIWKKTILEPRWKRRLTILKTPEGDRIQVDQLTIAYSRPPNLGNLLSYRNLEQRYGPPVSSFMITD